MSESEMIKNTETTKIPFYKRTAFKQYSPITIVLILLLIIGIVLSRDTFFTVTNMTNIVRQASILAIVGVAMTMIIISGGIDLSAASNLIVSSLVAGIIVRGGGSNVAAVIAALATGLSFGLANGLLIVKFKIPPFIVTLGTSLIGLGIALHISDGRIVSAFNPFFMWMGWDYLGFLPIPAVFAIIVVVIGIIIEKKTTIGRYMYAIGGNEEASKLSGINVEKYKLLIYSISGLFIGMASLVQLARIGAASSEIGIGTEMYAITAVVIGGTSIKGGHGSVIGTAVGVLILMVLNNILNMLNVPSASQRVFRGTILLVAIIIYQRQQKRAL